MVELPSANKQPSSSLAEGGHCLKSSSRDDVLKRQQEASDGSSVSSRQKIREGARSKSTKKHQIELDHGHSDSPAQQQQPENTAIRICVTDTSGSPTNNHDINKQNSTNVIGTHNTGYNQNGLLSNVDEVRRNFIALMRYNRVADFYLGAMIFAVIIIIFTIVHLVSTKINEKAQRDPMIIGRKSYHPDLSLINSCSLGAHSVISLVLLLLIMILLISLLVLFGFYLLTQTKDTFSILQDDEKKKFNPKFKTNKFGNARGSLATIDEVMILDGEQEVVIDGFNKKPPLKRNTKLRLSQRQLYSIGVVIIIVTLYLPIIWLSGVGQYSAKYFLKNSDRGSHSGICSPGYLSIATSLALAYFQPHLLEGGPMNAKLISTLTVLPLFLISNLDLQLLSIDLDHQQQLNNLRFTLISSICLPIIVLISFYRSWKLNKMITEETFDGASKLIEAKVGMENQRQQQETLLLSALPAYVADQVKRNMLRKMKTAPDSSQIMVAHKNKDKENNKSRRESSWVGAGGGAKGLGSNKSKASPFIGSGRRRMRKDWKAYNCCSADNFSGSIVSLDERPLDDTPSSGQGRFTVGAAGSAPAANYVPPNRPAPSLIQLSRGSFNELYIQTYNNVTLIYADIVGFTSLSSQFIPSQLVRVLNELFSLFDYLAEKHKIMRIKILGDCYYGVSGIPEFAVLGAKTRNVTRNDNHAINCVNMGLDMIHNIRRLNHEHRNQQSKPQTKNNNNNNNNTDAFRCCSSPIGGRLNSSDDEVGNKSGSMPEAFKLNMRIGVHSGHIHSGVIGLKKWQFDVWSNDVSIAMRCEACGTAGRVHATEATIQHLNGAFTYEETPPNERNSFFIVRGIKTYLIRDRIGEQKQFQTQLQLSGSRSSINEQSALTASSTTSQNKFQMIRNNNNNKQSKLTTSSNNNNNSSNNTKRLRQEVACLSPDLNHQHSSKQQVEDLSDRKQSSTFSLDQIETVQQTIESGCAAKVVDNSASGNKKANVTSNLKEDKIRAATIGTIRQTLLAGNPDLNLDDEKPIVLSYGLAFDHHDIEPIVLDYKDHTIRQLYDHSPIENMLQEVMLMFILLVFLLTIVNFLFISIPFNNNRNDNFEMKIILTISSIITFLVIFFLFFKNTRTSRNFKKLGSRRGHSLNKDAANRSHILSSSFMINQAVDSWTQQQNLLLDESSRNKNFDIIIDKGYSSNYENDDERNWFAIKLSYIRDWLSKNNKRSDAKLVAIILAHFIAISGQFYILFINNYNNNNNNNNNDQFELKTKLLSEQFYLILMIMIVSIDCCSNLMSFKSRSIMIISILIFAILFPLRSSSLLKLIYKLFIKLFSIKTTITTTTMTNSSTSVHQDEWLSSLVISLTCLWSLSYSRQMEYAKKVNFLWRNRLNVDHEELEYMGGVNKLLLENILPSHVVQYYLAHPNEQPNQSKTSQNQQQQQQQQQLPNHSQQPNTRLSFSSIQNLCFSNELYHEQHDNVAVMFASIPDFHEFYDESNINNQGLGCIALLNEIICDFDKLLLKNKFSRIEKIKTIGSTYMAASGLRPCQLTSGSRKSTISIDCASMRSPKYSLDASQCDSIDQAGQFQSEILQTINSNSNPTIIMTQQSSSSQLDGERRAVMSQQKVNLICMLQFSSSLMRALDAINGHSFQVFKLRIGIHTGPVVAGVIGAQRPFYDIWGDCVNIASRMESLGEIGRIQVEEKTANLLMDTHCKEAYSINKRGAINVKGKGSMVTYFVDKRGAASQSNFHQNGNDNS